MDTVLTPFLSTAMKVFFKGVHSFIASGEPHGSLQYNMSCQKINDRYKWHQGAEFFRCVHLHSEKTFIEQRNGFLIPTSGT